MDWQVNYWYIVVGLVLLAIARIRKMENNEQQGK